MANDTNISPLLTVLICTHNRCDLLTRAISSIQNQDFKDYQILLVNDHSTDGTSEYLKELDDTNNITIVNNPTNLGLQVSLANAMKLIETKYVARLDDDDYWTDNTKLRKQLALLEDDSSIALCGTSYHTDSQVFSNPHDDESLRLQIGFRCPFRHSTVVFRKSVYDVTNGYNSEVSYLEDWLLWLEMGKHGRLQNLPENTTYISEDENLSTEFFVKQHALIKSHVIPLISDYPKARLAKIYHHIVFVFFRIFPLNGLIHRTAQRIFQLVFSK